jgi:hypothetical protein
MNETAQELGHLQHLLDASITRAGAHLRSIIRPGERTLTARQLVESLSGMCVLSVATVTAAGEPRISAVDGHFFHARWVFSTSRSSVKARHLLDRPQVSAAHLRGEELGVFTHGTAMLLNPADRPPDPHWPAVLEHLTRYYGMSPLEWGDIVAYQLVPHWMVAYSSSAT